MPKIFTVDKDYQDSRFDRWFKNKVINVPHSLIEKLIRRNKVKVNKKKLLIIQFLIICLVAKPVFSQFQLSSSG